MIKATDYREVQRFRNPTLWLLVLGVAAVMWVGFVRQIILGQPFGTRPSSDVGLVIGWAAFGMGLPLLFWRVALVTEVDGAGVRVGFAPFPRRRIPWQQIRAAQLLTYQPLRDFGGWGLRSGWGRRRAYSISGNRGVELTLRDGHRVVIGSARPDPLHAANSDHVLDRLA
jgi:hypothetical protein